MERPQLLLTNSAKEALLHYLGTIDEPSVVTVLWSTEGEALNAARQVVKKLGPQWDVGFHRESKIPPDWLVRIDGIPFVFDQGPTSMRLDGATLDFVDGRFKVNERAI